MYIIYINTRTRSNQLNIPGKFVGFAFVRAHHPRVHQRWQQRGGDADPDQGTGNTRALAFVQMRMEPAAMFFFGGGYEFGVR